MYKIVGVNGEIILTGTKPEVNDKLEMMFYNKVDIPVLFEFRREGNQLKIILSHENILPESVFIKTMSMYLKDKEEVTVEHETISKLLGVASIELVEV